MSEKLIQAVKLFNLNETASINEINTEYKELLFKWHPDRTKEDPEKAKKMTPKIIEAYKILLMYCYDYKIPFGKNTIQGLIITEDPDRFWDERFGEDTLWGFNK